MNSDLFEIPHVRNCAPPKKNYDKDRLLVFKQRGASMVLEEVKKC